MAQQDRHRGQECMRSHCERAAVLDNDFPIIPRVHVVTQQDRHRGRAACLGPGFPIIPRVQETIILPTGACCDATRPTPWARVQKTITVGELPVLDCGFPITPREQETIIPFTSTYHRTREWECNKTVIVGELPPWTVAFQSPHESMRPSSHSRVRVTAPVNGSATRPSSWGSSRARSHLKPSHNSNVK